MSEVTSNVRCAICVLVTLRKEWRLNQTNSFWGKTTAKKKEEKKSLTLGGNRIVQQLQVTFSAISLKGKQGCYHAGGWNSPNFLRWSQQIHHTQLLSTHSRCKQEAVGYFICAIQLLSKSWPSTPTVSNGIIWRDCAIRCSLCICC